MAVKSCSVVGSIWKGAENDNQSCLPFGKLPFVYLGCLSRFRPFSKQNENVLLHSYGTFFIVKNTSCMKLAAQRVFANSRFDALLLKLKKNVPFLCRKHFLISAF